MKKSLLSLLTLVSLGIISCSNSYKPKKDGLYAVIETNKGDIVLELFYKKTPMTVGNFVALSEGTMKTVSKEYQGKKFYDGVKFHRVIKDFMIQTGDPKGNGTGGPGYKFEDEIVPELRHDKAGILSMANAGSGTNGSQFFITHKPTPHLDGRHTVFGKVVDSLQMKIVNSIVQGDVIKSIKIIRKGKEAKKFDAYKKFEEVSSKIVEDRKSKELAFQTEMNKYKAKAKELKSGLKIYIRKQGKGRKPKKGQVIITNYTGLLETGKMFDSSIEVDAKKGGVFNPRRPYGKFEFPVGVGKVIKGWDEGFLNMNVGTKAILFIPSELAYGKRGAGGVIPPNADLIFEVELNGIKK